MDTGLYSGVAAMDTLQRRLDTIAMNLANASTPAFKRVASTTQAFEVVSGGRRLPGLRTQQVVDFGQGALERTGNPLDLALMGEGFFAVESPQGRIYTRNGAFRLDEEGVLQTAEGYPVAWSGGRGRIEPVGDEVVVDASGAVRQGERDVGRLEIVGFDHPERLTPDRNGFFRASGGTRPGAHDAEVHQGALESSNTSAVDELVTLIQVQRSFDLASNLMRSLDQTYRRLVAPR